MGRGRAKAKQTKVARDLKYRSHETDFGALAKELHGDSPGSRLGGGTASGPGESAPEVEDYDDDPWTGRDSARSSRD